MGAPGEGSGMGVERLFTPKCRRTDESTEAVDPYMGTSLKANSNKKAGCARPQGHSVRCRMLISSMTSVAPPIRFRATMKRPLTDSCLTRVDMSRRFQTIL